MLSPDLSFLKNIVDPDQVASDEAIREGNGSVVECFTCGFEPHRRHCIVSLGKTPLSLLSTGSTQAYLKNADWDVKNQIKHTN